MATSFCAARGGLIAVAALLASAAHAQVSLNCSQNAFPNSMTQGSSYNLLCAVTGGTGPYQFTYTGAIPTGMTTVTFGAGSEYQVFGVTTAVGVYSFTVIATDTASRSASRAFTVAVTPAGSIITLTSLSQTILTPGTTATLYVYGTNFTPNSVVHFNNSAVSTSYVTTTELSATIPGSLITAGVWPVYVTDAVTGMSGALSVTVTSLSSISPASAPVGQSFTLSIFGTGFTPGSLLSFGTICTLSTTFVSSNQLTATVPGSCMTTAQVLNVSVGASNSIPFTIGDGSGGPVTLSSVAPATFTPGVQTVFYFYGSNFTANSVVHFNGYSVVPTFSSSSQLYATIPGSYLTAGSLAVYITDPTYGTSVTIYVNSTGSTITLTSLTPTTLQSGVQTVLFFSGTNFTSNTLVHFNGTALTPFYQSSSTIYATIPGSIITSGSLPVYLTDSGTSATLYVTVSGGATGPALTSISPASVAAGSPSVTITIYGSGFVSGTLLNFGSVCTVSTTFVSGSQLLATIPAACLTTAQTVSATVGASNAILFTIGSSGGPISLSSLSPTTLTTGVTTTLYVFGANFTSNSAIHFNGATMATTFVNSSQLFASISGSSITAGSPPVYVSDSSAGTSNTLYVTVPASGLTLTSLSPTGSPAGTSFTLTLNGTGFAAGLQLAFGTCTTSTTFNSPSQLTSFVPAACVPSAQTVNVSVTGSNSLPFVIGSALTLTSIYPASVTAGSGTFSLNLYGSGFTSATLVTFGGAVYSPTLISQGQLQVSIPAAAVAAVQTLGVSASGTNALTFAVTAATSITSTTTSLSTSANPATFGQLLTLTATVTPATATGKVTFYDGVTVLGTAAVASGKAVFPARPLTTGKRPFQARYLGSNSFGASLSSAVPETVRATASQGYMGPGNIVGSLASDGAVAADFNGDGYTDLASSGDTFIQVFPGNGDGTFRAGISSAAPSAGLLFAGDFNGDGVTDLALLPDGANGVDILLGNGDGSFRAAVSYAVGTGIYSLTVGDFNGDGKADLAVTDGDGVDLLLGNGDGTFQPVASIVESPFITLDVVAADVNGDGKPDLIVMDAYSNEGSINVLLGNGDGTFQPGKRYTPQLYSTLAVGDFNGDGKVDIATFGSEASVALLLGNGDGSFQAATSQSILGVGFPDTVIAGDLNGDGNTDILACVSDGTLTLLAGAGDGSFPTRYRLTAGGSSCNLFIADFNGDGRPDLVSVGQNGVTVQLGGTPQPSATVLTTSVNPSKASQPVTLNAIVPVTFDGFVTFYDGATVLGSTVNVLGLATLTVNNLAVGSHSLTAFCPGSGVLLPSTSNTVTQVVSGAIPQALVTLASSLNPARYSQQVNLTATVSPASATGKVTFYDGVSLQGTRTLVNGQAVLTTGQLSSGKHSLSAEYSGDANNAPGVSNGLTQTVTTVAAGGLSAPASYPLGASPVAVVTGDFNGDGRPDFAVAMGTATNNIAVYFGKGDGTFQPPVVSGVTFVPAALAAGDLNGDGILDLVVSNPFTVSAFLGHGDGTFTGNTLNPNAALGTLLVVADFNGDGRPDLGSLTGIALGTGDGFFQYPLPIAGSGHEIALGDFNGDGKPDIITAGGAIFLGKGDGTFEAPITFPGNWNYMPMATGDFNGDGKLDLAVGNTVSGALGVSVLLGNGDGTLRSPVSYSLEFNPTALAATDLDGDGKLDLVTNSGGSVVVLPGNGDGTFRTPNIYAGGTVVQGLAIADFNLDGRPDVVAVSGNAATVLLGIAGSLRFSSINATGHSVTAVVQLLDLNGNPAGTASAPVTISYAGSTATATAVNGVATVSNLVINSPGTYTLSATAPAYNAATGSIAITSVPVVFIDSPPAGAIRNNTVIVAGWAVPADTPGTPISSVLVNMDGVFQGAATYGLPRGDVCAAYTNRAGCPNVGYTYALNLTKFLPGPHTLTVTATDSSIPSNTSSVTETFEVTNLFFTGSAVGIYRPGQGFMMDSNGNEVGPFPTDPNDRVDGFAPPGGVLAGDVPVVGDWNGDGHAKAGFFRPSTGKWWLDLNNDGIYTPGVDLTYNYGGIPGDMPVVGDWNHVLGVLGYKTCVGIYRSVASEWLLDLNCNGKEEPSPTDAFFPFGGLPGDVFVVGDWNNSGISLPGVYRGGLWYLDLTGQHTTFAFFGYGGLSTDVPITGRW